LFALLDQVGRGHSTIAMLYKQIVAMEG
jgi:hypothetical protein